MSSGDAEVYIFFFMLAGLGSYLWGLGQYRLKKFIEYTPTSKAVSVAPGIAEVAGKARAGEKTFQSPFEQKQCVYYQTQLYKWQGSGKHRNRLLVQKFESGDPFYLEDETGRVIVRANLEKADGGGFFNDQIGSLLSHKKSFTKEMLDTDARFKGSASAGLLSFLGLNTDPRLKRFLSEFAPSYSNYGDTLEVYERRISEGDQIYMLGRAKECEVNGKQGIMVGRDEEKGIFCIADGSEKRALSGIAIWAYLALLAGPAIFVGLLHYFLSFRLKVDPETALQISALIVFALYAYVFSIFVAEFYNGMIILRNNVSRARSNVGVLLKRRHDLIENLTTVVSAAAKHEKSVMEKIAEARAGMAGGSGLLAIAENYPHLQASANFTALSAELSRTESWIAGARTYVSDSIMLYNSKIGSFPYFLFAPALGLKQIDFGEARD